jgi:hypothetical protein
MGGVDRQTGLFLVVVCALVVAVQLNAWTAKIPRLRWVALPLVGTILILPTALIGAPDLRETGSWMPHAWVRATLARLPPGALLLTQSDDMAAGVFFARVVEGARPDVLSMPAQHLHKPPPDHWASRPEFAQLLSETAAEPTEIAQIQGIMKRHRGGVALEYPRTGLFRPIEWWGEPAILPIRVSQALDVAALSAEEETAQWLERSTGRMDRLRLATALEKHTTGQYRQHRDLDRARQILEFSLLEVMPDHAGSLVSLGAILDRAGDGERAVALTRQARLVDPAKTTALNNLALYLSRSPQTLAEALQLAQYAVDLRPWRVQGWTRLASIHATNGDEAAAKQARDRAAELGAPP